MCTFLRKFYFFIFKIGLFWERAIWLSKGYLCDTSVFFLVSSTIFFNSNIGVFFFYRKLHKFSNDSLDQINQNVSVRESN